MDHGKRNNASKVYVVFRGKRPGLYISWHRCAPMVIGVKGSMFKAFKTYDDAIAAFNEFRNGPQADNILASKVYVVFRCKKLGLYNSWCECAPMVIGFKGSIFKSYKSYVEAVATFNEFQKENVYSEEQSLSLCVDESDVGASAMSSVLLAELFVGMKISKNCSV
ncbi:uncharacterized protein LOC142162184 [Nicotiana tabacum]|uniref:Uncharacterized protein LOC142162184 n=1 Tax=Nicotiana tabacum TaxID=4097 RepID=A0AC58RPF1_TOBAC